MTVGNLTLAISELYVYRIAASQSTMSHRRILQEAICALDLVEEERSAIARLLWATVHG